MLSLIHIYPMDKVFKIEDLRPIRDEMTISRNSRLSDKTPITLSLIHIFPTKLEAIKEDDLDFLAESAHADACAPGNPKDASVEDLKALFRKIM